ncbi:MAG TPA: hypothetical protein VF885_00315 [Arthrobacter sp.]
MIRNLPEGARFTAAMSVDQAEEISELRPFFEADPRREAILDHRTWTIDRRLQATEINAIYSQISVSGNWGKEGPPDFPVIGPAAWQPSEKQSNELRDNFDVLRKMGWPGG